MKTSPRTFLAAALLVLPVLTSAHAQTLYSVTTTNNLINTLNPDTGALLNSYATPSPTQGSGGDALGASATALYYTTIDVATIYVLNPLTGAVVTSYARPAGAVDGLGYGTSSFGPTLFAHDYSAHRIDLLNPTTGASFANYTVSFDAIGGIDFDPVTNTLFVSDATGGIHELNPNTGAQLNSFATPAFEYGLGFVGGRLFTSANDGNIVERNAVTGVAINTFVSPGGNASALAGAVPEPATATLLVFALGLGGFVRPARRGPTASA